MLGEGDALIGQTLREMLTGNGCLVHPVAHGPEVLEKAILARPDIIVMNSVLATDEDAAVVRMLSEMPNTRLVPIVVYGAEDSSILPATVRQRATIRCVADSGGYTTIVIR